uniref:Uncharacterized protein n=1 Tax=Ditylenchus dipsaci TaxID=166011 RepID=A0A915EI96_9BILA
MQEGRNQALKESLPPHEEQAQLKAGEGDLEIDKAKTRLPFDVISTTNRPLRYLTMYAGTSTFAFAHLENPWLQLFYLSKPKEIWAMNHILSYLNASRNFFRDVIPDEHILPVLVFNSPSATADTYSAAVQLLVTCNVQLLRGPALRNQINPVPGNSDPFVIFGQAVQRDLQ